MKISSITNENIFDLHPDKERARQLKAKATETDPKLAWQKYYNNVDELEKREHLWARHPGTAFDYAYDVIGGRFPAGEAAIMTDPHTAAAYATDIMRYRWYEAEDVIASSPTATEDYAYHFNLHYDPNTKTFSEGTNEDIFALHPDKKRARQLKVKAAEKDPMLAWPIYWPDKEEIKKREHLWLKNPWLAFVYANEVLDSRWPEAEAIIATNPNASFSYAKYVIKGRWPKGEKAIVAIPVFARMYANLFDLRFDPESETFSEKTNENIFDLHPDKERAARLKDKATEKNPELAWEMYKDDIDELQKREHLWLQDPKLVIRYVKKTKERFPEGEDVIKKHPKYATRYAMAIGEPFPEGEAAIATDARSARLYAITVLKDRWPEGESAIAKDGIETHNYVHQLRYHNVYIVFDWNTMQFREST